uniref:Retrotransposon protein, putative, Ty1-copia subclass n=1 Tax=Tanacetum cinerariifolium TaxID=118510 RepID=A0A6L2L5G4_TANCI|nr:retrotransposon protein, putative, Ty1-copia subclass [Tanacetum cinerariifolium]
MSDEDWIELDEKALATIQLFLTREVLREVIHETTAAGTYVQDHLEEFNTILIDLENLDVDIDDVDKAVLLVISLPASYKHFKEIMLYGNRETLSFDDVKSTLLSKQKYDDNVETESGKGSVARGQSSDRGESSNKNKKHRSQSRRKYSNKSCKYCKKLGHIVSDCYKLKNKLEREGKGNNEKKPKKAVEVAIAKGDSDSDVYLAIDTEKSKDELIVDSGCTFHMIPHRIKMHDGVVRTITEVRHILDLKRNLISLSTLEANRCKYSGERGVMKIFKGALVLMKVIQLGSLYVLQGTAVYGTAGVATSKASRDDSKLWHYRLGHMGEKGIQNLAKKGLIKVSCNLEFCEHCVFGKQKRVSFSPGIHRTRDALDYIHFDLWGPSPVTSRGGKRYMLTIIDDFSLKKIKKLRTDNGLEFYGESFNALCRKYDIARHHTLVRTPQQNIIVERINRTIMEKVRCMLSHANLDKDFWVEAATTTTYLINHFPHRSLDGNIPEILWLGYGFGVKGYRVWCPDPKYHKIIHSRHVTFNEDVIINSGKDFVPPYNVDNNHTEGKVEFEFDVENSTHTQPPSHIENCDPTNYLKAISSPKCDKMGYGNGRGDGIPEVESNRYKARYVVRGFGQCEGINFNELFYPLVRHTSIVALHDLELEQLDVKTTFLHGHLEEEIYVEQPEDGSFLYLVLYVDDMLIAAPNKDQIRELKYQLINEFDMKDLGAAKRILGMKIRRDQKMGKLTLSQTDYISKVLKKFNMSSCKPVPTPLAPHFKLSSHKCPKSEEDKEDISRVSYSSAVGSLMYVMVCTRPDLAHAVSLVSRYKHNPGKMHWEAVKCIIRYLKGTCNIGLSFEKGRACPNGIVGYVDFDYAGDLDARKSLSSYIFSHCVSAISWYSSLQAITALSTTEVENISSTEEVKEGRNFLNWYGPQAELVITDPDIIKEIASNRSVSLARPDLGSYHKKMLGDGLVTSKGEKWARQRKLANHAFSAESLKSMIPAIVESVEMILLRWKKMSGNEVEMNTEFRILTADLISKTAFGTSYLQGKEVFDMLKEMSSIAGRNYYNPRLLGLGKILKNMDIDAWGTDFLGHLVNATHDSDERYHLSIQDIIDECKTFYVSGDATTSLLLSWAVLLLSIHKEWQEKARNEVFELFALHHDRKIWGEDAHLFKPERFLEGVSKATKDNPSAYMPFGFGPRNCVGSNFAINTAKVTLAMILQSYRFIPSPSYIHSPVHVVLLIPKNGLQVMLHDL